MEFANQMLSLAGAIIAAIVVISGVAISKGKKETKSAEGPSQVSVLKHSIDENTKAQQAMTYQLANNTRHLESISASVANVERMASDVLVVSRGIDRAMIEVLASRKSGK